MSLKDCKVGTAVPVSDMARAKEFYEGTLGLEPDQQGDEMASYQCGGGTGLFVYVTEHAGTNEATLAGFEVQDFDAEHSDLKERGVEFERYDEGAVKTDDDGILDNGTFRVAFFKDPDGNIFSING
ncbi:MAG TPA: VOC family protein [Solirubrobacterales bacterium]|nr:VOC family protein [Solirubrobacterales bacterium]